MMRSIKSYLPIVLGLLFLSLVVWLSGPMEILGALGQTKIPFLVLAALSVMTTYLVQTFRFRSLVSTFYRPPPIFRTFQIVISAAITNIVMPGGGGDILLRPYLMKKMDKRSFKKTFLCVFLERLLDLFFLLLLVLVAVLVIIPQYWLIVVAVIAAGSVVFLSLLFLPGKYLPFELPRIIVKYVRVVRRMRKIPLKSLTITVLYTLLNVFFIVLNVFLVVLALNMTPTFELIGIFFISALAGVISLIPGGLGVTDGSVAGLFYLLGHEPSIGISIALMNRFVILGVSLIFAVGLLPKMKRK